MRQKNLRAEITGALKHSYTPWNNITKEDSKVLKELREDETRIILTADKDVAIVVMDKPEYTSKAKVLQEGGESYQEIQCDPSSKYKKKLINPLQKIKTERVINSILYKKMFSSGATAPKFYGLPKIHKRGIPSDL